MSDGFIYLVSPYSHPDSMVCAERYLLALEATKDLLNDRRWVYSPIVHCHHMSIFFDLPGEVDFWKEYDRVMIRASLGIAVLCIDGWETSVGVNSEIAYAKEINKPVEYIWPKKMTL